MKTLELYYSVIQFLKLHITSSLAFFYLSILLFSVFLQFNNTTVIKYYCNSNWKIVIAAPVKEQHQLGNETISVEVEKKTEQWLGATLQSTGENGNVLVSLSVQAISRRAHKSLQASVLLSA